VKEVVEQDKFKNVCDTVNFEDVKTENWGKMNTKEAMFYTTMPSGAVKCNLCARGCIIQPGKRGYCGVRENRNGTLYSLVYGKVAAYAIDPIEKKPFYHFFPGTLSFSLSTVGCNFRCPWCFPPNTPIVTDEGILSIEEIFEKGEKTLHFDGGEFGEISKIEIKLPTHTGESLNAVKAFKHYYSGDLVVIKPYYLPELKATPNHKIFVMDSNGLSKIEASKITKSHYLVIPKKYRFYNAKRINLRELLKTNIKSIPKFIKLDSNFARLLGYFYSKGRISKRGSNIKLEFSFKKNELEKIREVNQLLKKFFKAKSKTENHKGITKIVVGQHTALFFQLICEDEYGKVIPQILFKAKKSTIRSFINALYELHADGNYVSSTSKKFAFGIFGLLLKIGVLPKFYTYKNKYIIQLDSKMKKKIFEDDSFYFIPIEDIRNEKYSGEVYNLEVEKNHSYLANFTAVANCQNWEISQPTQIFGEEFTPKDIVKMAKGSSGISYTYTEPTVFFEFARDCATLGRKEGLYNTFVSNGYMSDEAMEEAVKFLDAIRIDLKAFNPETYRKYLAADIEVVKKNIKEFNKRIHTEVINLIIPEVNDSPDEIRALCEWLKEIDKTIPLHFTAYYPAHKFTKPPTPLETLIKARNIGLDVGLEYVYTGNIPGYEGENTYCPNCGTLLIERYGFMVIKNILLRDGNFAKCPECGRKIKVVMKLDWMEKI
jgi:pyruvate formate lyase activating enzyme